MSGPEGTPNGVDRLAHIEDVASGGIHHPLMTISRADVLALVEIAKAARPMANLPYPLSADERTQWLTRQGELRSALARLDSGAAEENA